MIRLLSDGTWPDGRRAVKTHKTYWGQTVCQPTHKGDKGSIVTTLNTSLSASRIHIQPCGWGCVSRVGVRAGDIKKEAEEQKEEDQKEEEGSKRSKWRGRKKMEGDRRKAYPLPGSHWNRRKVKTTQRGSIQWCYCWKTFFITECDDEPTAKYAYRGRGRCKQQEGSNSNSIPIWRPEAHVRCKYMWGSSVSL